MRGVQQQSRATAVRPSNACSIVLLRVTMRGSRMMPAYQGEFDGLCGMYAIANAYEICGYGEICDKLFQISCGGLAHDRWPEVLWQGTSFGDMMRMIKACQRYIDSRMCKRTGIKGTVDIGYPFWKKTPRSNSIYWEVLMDIFKHYNVRCGIVGLTAPVHHWVVISRDTERRVWFTGSGRGELEYRKNLASLHAGERRRMETQWRLDRRELVVFYDVV